MIRLVILLLFLILLWLLIASGFERRKKIVLGLLLLGIAIAGFFFEGYDKREHTNLLQESQVQSCGVTAKPSYRSNFDFQLCLQNLAETGVVSRLKMAVIAKVCPDTDGQQCFEVERVVRDIPVKIMPMSQVSIMQNLSFKQVAQGNTQVQWSFEVISIKATRK
jgi:hypothetical protein